MGWHSPTYLYIFYVTYLDNLLWRMKSVTKDHLRHQVWVRLLFEGTEWFGSYQMATRCFSFATWQGQLLIFPTWHPQILPPCGPDLNLFEMRYALKSTWRCSCRHCRYSMIVIDCHLEQSWGVIAVMVLPSRIVSFWGHELHWTPLNHDTITSFVFEVLCV